MPELERLTTRLVGDDSELNRVLDRAEARTQAFAQVGERAARALGNAFSAAFAKIGQQSEAAAARATRALETLAAVKPNLDLGPLTRSLASVEAAAGRSGNTLKAALAGTAPRIDLSPSLNSLRTLESATQNAGTGLRRNLAGIRPTLVSAPFERDLQGLGTGAQAVERALRASLGTFTPRLNTEGVVRPMSQVTQAALIAGANVRLVVPERLPAPPVAPLVASLQRVQAVGRQTAASLAGALSVTVARLDVRGLEVPLRTAADRARQVGQIIHAALEGIRVTLDAQPFLTPLQRVVAASTATASRVQTAFSNLRISLVESPATQALGRLGQVARQVAVGVRGQFENLRVAVETGQATAALTGFARRAVIAGRQAAEALGTLSPRLDLRLVLAPLATLGERAGAAVRRIQQAFAAFRPQLDVRAGLSALTGLQTRAQGVARAIRGALADIPLRIDTSAVARALAGTVRQSQDGAREILRAFNLLRPRVDLSSLARLPALAGQIRAAFQQAAPSLDLRGLSQSLQGIVTGSQTAARSVTAAMARLGAALAGRVAGRPTLDLSGILAPLQGLGATATRAAQTVARALGNLRPSLDVSAVLGPLARLRTATDAAGTAARNALGRLRPALDVAGFTAGLRTLADGARATGARIAQALTGARVGVDLSPLQRLVAAGRQAAGAFRGLKLDLDTRPAQASAERLASVAGVAAGTVRRAFAALRAVVDVSPAQRALQSLGQAAQSAAQGIRQRLAGLALTLDTSAAGRALTALQGIASTTAARLRSALAGARASIDTGAARGALGSLAQAAVTVGGRIKAAVTGIVARVDTKDITKLLPLAIAVSTAFATLHPHLNTAGLTEPLQQFSALATAVVSGVRAAWTTLKPKLEARGLLEPLRGLPAAAGSAARGIATALGNLRPQINVATVVAGFQRIGTVAGNVAGTVRAAFAGLRPQIVTQQAVSALGDLAARAGEAAARITRALGNLKPQVDLTSLLRLPAVAERIQAAFSRVRLLIPTDAVTGALNALGQVAQSAGGRTRAAFSAIGTTVQNVGQMAGQMAGQVQQTFAALRPTIDVSAALLQLRQLPALASGVTRAIRESLAGAAAGFSVANVVTSLRNLVQRATATARQIGTALSGALPPLNTQGAQQAFNTLRQAAASTGAFIRTALVARIGPPNFTAWRAGLQQIAGAAAQFGQRTSTALMGGIQGSINAVGSAFLRLGGTISGTTGNATANIQRMGQAWQAISFGRTLEANITRPVIAAGKSVFDAAIEIDSLKRSLGLIMGSASAAEVEFRKLIVAAKIPGLGFKEAIQGSVRLQAVGLNADDARKALTGFATAISRGGGRKADLEVITRELVRMAGQSKLTAREIRVITARAPETIAAIKSIYGTADIKQLADRGIGGKQFIRAVSEALAGLKSAAESPQNALDNLGDSFLRLKGTIGSSLIPFLRAFDEVVSPAIDHLRTAFENLTPQVQHTILAIAAGAAALGPLIVGAGLLRQAWLLLGPLFTGIGTALLGITAPMAAVGVAVAAGLALITVAYAKNWGGIQQRTAAAMEDIRNTVVQAMAVLQAAWRVAWAGLSQVVLPLLSAIKEIVTGALQGVIAVVNVFALALSGNWDKALSVLEEGVISVGQALGRAFVALLQSLLGIVTGFFASLNEVAPAAGAAGLQLGASLGKGVGSGIVQSSQKALVAMEGFFLALLQGGLNPAAYVGQHLGESLGKQIVGSIQRFFSGKQDLGKGLAEGVGDSLAKAAPKQSAFEKAIQSFMKAWNAPIEQLKGNFGKAFNDIGDEATPGAQKMQDAFVKAIDAAKKELAELRAPNLVAKIKAEFEYQISDAQARSLAAYRQAIDQQRTAIDQAKQALDGLASSLKDFAKDLLQSANQLPAGPLRSATEARAGALQNRSLAVSQSAQLPLGFSNAVGASPQAFAPILQSQFNIQRQAIAQLGETFGRNGCALAVSSILSGSVQGLEGLKEASVQGLVKRLTSLGAQAVAPGQQQAGDVAVFNRGVLGSHAHTGVVAEQGGQLGIVHNSSAAGHKLAFDAGLMKQASVFYRLAAGATDTYTKSVSAAIPQVKAFGAAEAALNDPAIRSREVFSALSQRFFSARRELALLSATTAEGKVNVELLGREFAASDPLLVKWAQSTAAIEEALRRAQLEKTIQGIGKGARQEFLVAKASTDAERIALDQLGLTLASLPQSWQAVIERSAEFSRQAKAITAVADAQREFLAATAQTRTAELAITEFRQAFEQLSPAIQASLKERVAWERATARAQNVRDATSAISEMRLEMAKTTATTELQRRGLDLLRQPLDDYAAGLRALGGDLTEHLRQQEAAAKQAPAIAGAFVAGALRFVQGGAFAAAPRIAQTVTKALESIGQAGHGAVGGLLEIGRALTAGRYDAASQAIGLFSDGLATARQAARETAPDVSNLSAILGNLGDALAAGSETRAFAALGQLRPIFQSLSAVLGTTNPLVAQLGQAIKEVDKVLQSAQEGRALAFAQGMQRLGEASAAAAQDLERLGVQSQVEQRTAQVTAQAIEQLSTGFLQAGGNVDAFVQQALQGDATLQSLRQQAAVAAAALDAFGKSASAAFADAVDQLGLDNAINLFLPYLDSLGKVRTGSEDAAAGSKILTDAFNNQAGVTRHLQEALAETAIGSRVAATGADLYQYALEKLGLTTTALTDKQKQLAVEFGEKAFRAELIGRVTAARNAMEAATGTASKQVQILREMGIEWSKLGDEEKRFATKQVNEILKFEAITQFADGVKNVFQNAFTDLYQHGFKGFFNSVVQGFEQMLQQMAAQYLASQIATLVGNVFGLGGGGKKKGAGGAISGAGGAIGSILGGILSGTRAMGGEVQANRAYWVGEQQPEVFVPRQSGTVMNQREMAAAGGGGGDVNISITVHATDANSFRRSQGQIADEVQRSLALAARRSGR